MYLQKYSKYAERGIKLEKDNLICRELALPLCSINALKEKEVINISDGARLGNVLDVEFDLYIGRLVSIKVSLSSGFLGFISNKDMLRIPWEQIEKIGDDIILVRASHSLNKIDNGRTKKEKL